MNYIDDYISGEKFEKFVKELNNKEIFYINQYSLRNGFPSNIDNIKILVTHNSDLNISSKLISTIGIIPENIIKWYAQNVDFKNDKLASLPIGLENLYNFPNLRKIEKMSNKLKEEKTKKNILYINHDITTNTFSNDRQQIYLIFKNEKWSTCESGKNGYDFENYLDNIYNHDFVACPEGNGIDTHRIWECLYMNTIPIVKRCINTTFYEDLPICFVNKWEDITEEFLNSEYERIKNSSWNFDKLTMNYWKKRIMNR